MAFISAEHEKNGQSSQQTQRNWMKKWDDEEIWILKNFSFRSVKIADRDERKIEEFNNKNHEWWALQWTCSGLLIRIEWIVFNCLVN